MIVETGTQDGLDALGSSYIVYLWHFLLGKKKGEIK